MSRAGGSTSRAEISRISIGSSGHAVGQVEPGRLSDDDLERALDRLSLSLQRIERLLRELRGVRRPHCSGGQAPAADATPTPAASEDAHVVHGGGPSAFARRQDRR